MGPDEPAQGDVMQAGQAYVGECQSSRCLRRPARQSLITMATKAALTSV